MEPSERHRTPALLATSMESERLTPFLQEAKFAWRPDAFPKVEVQVFRESPFVDRISSWLPEEFPVGDSESGEDLSERRRRVAEEELISGNAAQSETPDIHPDEQDLDCEGELTDAEVWTESGEQVSFRRRVLDEQLARSRRRHGAPQPDLSNDDLEIVPGTRVSTGRETARAAGRLLAAASADLQKAKEAGDVDAGRTVSITVNSGYRTAQHQLGLWLGYFPAYYKQTRAVREGLPGGSHSDQAVDYLINPKANGGFGLAGRIAAPGYSNHQNGIAVDFKQFRRAGHEVKNSSRDEWRQRWRDSWFHHWLSENAALHGFKPIGTEEWHWEYRGEIARVAPSRPSVGNYATSSRHARTVVLFAQSVLNASEGEHLTEDGNLGPLTRGALRRFRNKYRLGTDDVLDKRTELALVQRALEGIRQQSLFARVGVVDAATRKALTEFRLVNGLGDGTDIDGATRLALANALRRPARQPATRQAELEVFDSQAGSDCHTAKPMRDSEVDGESSSDHISKAFETRQESETLVEGKGSLDGDAEILLRQYGGDDALEDAPAPIPPSLSEGSQLPPWEHQLPPVAQVNWCQIRQAIAASARGEAARWLGANRVQLFERQRTQLPILIQYWSAVPGFSDLSDARAAARRSAADDQDWPWSAALVCFVMRAAGVVPTFGFDFSRRHLTYIVGALRNRERSDRTRPFWLSDQLELQYEVVPQPGDLLCFNREGTNHSYESLRRQFWSGGNQDVPVRGVSHSSIVVGVRQHGARRVVETIGGNEDNSVRVAQFPLNAEGGIANPREHQMFAMIKLIRC